MTTDIYGGTLRSASSPPLARPKTGTGNQKPSNTSQSTRRRNRLLAIGALLALVLVAGACAADDTELDDALGRDSVQLMTPDDYSGFLTANPEVTLINVHVPYEGEIEGTDEFVAFDQILDWDGLPTDRDTPVVLYCRSGNMSGQAARALEGAGYTNIVDLEGGMNAWMDSGRSLDNNPPTATP